MDPFVGHLDSVICGDNVDVMATWPNACIDLVVTSPPYDDLRKYGGHSWDFPAVARELTRILKPGGVIVWVVGDATVDGSETGTSFRQALAFMGGGLNLHDTMIFASDKPPLNSNRYEPAFEFMFVFSRGAPATCNKLKTASIHAGKVNATRRYYRSDGGLKEMSKPGVYNDEKVLPNIWWFSTGQEKTGHPAVFPSALARDHILSWSNPGDVVLDPFAGSGTTLKMAKEHGRRFIGIEVCPEYVAICEKRVAQGVLPLVPNADLTGKQKPEKEVEL